MAKEPNLILGVDIGGSHITAGLVDMENKGVLTGSVIRNKVDRHGAAETILTSWVDTIKKAHQATDLWVCRIGFAMPGPFKYDDGICLIKGFDKYESLYGMNIRNELAERLNLLPGNILFRNDAEAFLEGELFCGAGQGFGHAIGITLGTGLGSALSHLGVTKDAELSVLPYKGEKIEEWVSTRGLLRIYKELTGKTVTEALDIADRYDSDKYAKETIEKFAGHLSWFLQQFISQERPEVLVIGGNISKSYHLFQDQLIKNLRDAGVPIPNIALASLGEDALLIGAACKFLPQPGYVPN